MSFVYVWETRLIRPYKQHRCHGCNDPIPQHAKCWVYKGINTEGYFNFYYHEACWHYTEDWTDDDWESHFPGDFSRLEAEGKE